MSKQESCEERKQEHFQSRMDDLRLLFGAYQQGRDEEEGLCLWRCDSKGCADEGETWFNPKRGPDAGGLFFSDDCGSCGEPGELVEELDNVGRFHEYGLAFDYVAAGTFRDQSEGYFRYQISWGGPSEEFRFYANAQDHSCYKVEFWFLDWFDGAKVNPQGADREFLMELWEYFREVGTVDALLNELDD